MVQRQSKAALEFQFPYVCCTLHQDRNPSKFLLPMITCHEEVQNRTRSRCNMSASLRLHQGYNIFEYLHILLSSPKIIFLRSNSILLAFPPRKPRVLTGPATNELRSNQTTKVPTVPHNTNATQFAVDGKNINKRTSWNEPFNTDNLFKKN